MTDSFTDLYVSYAKDITDAPESFHRVLAYFIVSSMVGKNVFFPFGYRKLYCNLYILIGAASSVHRKSWSQDMALNLINEVCPGLELPDFSSREAFIAEMAEEERVPVATAMFAVDELGGFLKRIKHKHHFEGFMQDLASCYDAKTIYRRTGANTDSKKITRIDSPFLNFTAACSFDWLTDSAETSDITGGFLARFLWVIEDGKVSDPQPKPGTENQNKKAELIERMIKIKSIIGIAAFDLEADKIYSDWYKAFRTQFQGGVWDANYERMTVIVQKIALINTIMRMEEHNNIGGNVVSIMKGDLFPAISMIEDMTQNFNKVIIGDNKMDAMAQRVKKFIFKRNRCTHSEVLQGVRGVNAWFLKSIIQTLEESDIIEVFQAEENSSKKSIVYQRNGLKEFRP